MGCQKKINDVSVMQMQGSAKERPAPPAEKNVALPEPRVVVNKIYFGYDSYDLDEESDVCVDYADFYMQHTGKKLVIDGHCDERGSRDYNMGLGQRRAMAVRNGLVAAGVPASAISVRSFGKEKTLVWGSNEEAWAQNRVAIIRMVS